MEKTLTYKERIIFANKCITNSSVPKETSNGELELPGRNVTPSPILRTQELSDAKKVCLLQLEYEVCFKI
jgi:hypothetical protein